MVSQQGWVKFNEKGITWGDVMHGIMMNKGSKCDWNYEMIIGFEVKVRGDTLYIVFSCDHGS